MRYVAAFRTHLWDEPIAQLAARLAGACPSSRFVVLTDETNGKIDVPPYEKIAHTDDAGIFGLPRHPTGRSLWYNGDYALYFLHQALPDYDYYLLSEYDVAVNTDVGAILRKAAERGLDLIAHDIQPSTMDWFWHRNAVATFSIPWRSLVFFLIVSRRALLLMLEARQEFARRFAAGELGDWPFCEVFIPSVVHETTGMKVAELREFADVQNLRFRPYIRLEDDRANRPGALAHPVLGTKRYISAVLAESNAGDYFRLGTDLRSALEPIGFEDLVVPLRERLLDQRDHGGIALLRQEMERRGLPEDPTLADLALCKPALSSSVSSWSRSQNRDEDAAGANGATLPDDFGFHTDQEAGPWWMADLMEDYLVEEVAIVNRTSYPERFRTFTIESSRDANAWITRFAKLDHGDVSADPASPWRVVFADPFLARYLRIRLSGHGVLHLRRVQVFGRALCPHYVRA